MIAYAAVKNGAASKCKESLASVPDGDGDCEPQRL